MQTASARIAALYIRVSTDKQEELSPDAQKRLLLDYAEKNNMIVSEQYIFIESGISGKKADKRPQFQKMIGLAKQKDHPFHVILVWKYSRFARNQEESIVYKSLLKKNGVDVISISEPLVDGPFGSLIERIIEWMDEYYSIRLSGEVYRGMTEKALRGGYQASPPLGYRIEHHGAIPVIVSEEAEIVKTIFNKYVYEGLTSFQLAKYLNALNLKTKQGKKFERRSVEYIIQNPIYMGYIRWNRVHNDSRTVKDESEWIIEKGEQVPIISEELFEKAQERFNREYAPLSKSRPVTEYKHWLSGLIKCVHCGRTMTSSTTTRSKYRQFICNGYNKGKCPISNSVSENILIPYIMKNLEEIIASEQVEYEIIKHEYKSDTTLLEQQLNKIFSKEKRVKNAYVNGIDTLEEYKRNKEMLLKEKEDVMKQINQLKNNIDKDHTSEMVQRIKEVYQIITDDKIDNITKNKAMKSIIEKIVYNKREGIIDFYYYYS
ncbi:recombinase family protein [Anaerocolumna aminovalerica]|uniref:recombinase family protein n=1 Tax=Anaerocolumna aminovalerica TaxID=1527 RepID=UPI000BE35DFA|nr:recombinase family protein [Anaerocolumna aminovalerica]